MKQGNDWSCDFKSFCLSMIYYNANKSLNFIFIDESNDWIKTSPVHWEKCVLTVDAARGDYQLSTYNDCEINE